LVGRTYIKDRQAYSTIKFILNMDYSKERVRFYLALLIMDKKILNCIYIVRKL